MSQAGTLRSSPALRSAVHGERNRTVVRLWLPLTPLWIVLAPFALVAAPALRFSPATRGVSPFRTVWAVGRLLFALSGTLIDIDSPAAIVRIHIL